METGEERKARAGHQKRRKAESYRRWVEGTTDRLADAWISVCPHAASHEVLNQPLFDVIDCIRTGCSIRVPGRYGSDQYVDLAEKQEVVRRLFQRGVEEAKVINDARMVRLLRAIGIEGVDPSSVEPILEQPKKNEKLYFVKELRIGDRVIPVLARPTWARPQDAGKEKASNAKKYTPCACLSGMFHPHRNSVRLVRATGLFPIDIDGLSDLTELREKKREIEADETVQMVFTSISGSGLRACVLADEAKNAAQYTALYKEIATVKSKEWGVEAEIDDDTSDVSRLCFLPYDPDLYYG